MDTWVLRMVRQRCLRRVVAWGLALGLAALATYSQARYLRNFFGGPYTLGEAELAAIDDAWATPRYFARVTGTETADTGIQQITVEKRSGREVGRRVSAAYYVLFVGDRLLLVKSAVAARTTVEGELRRLPYDLQAQLLSSEDAKAAWPRFFSFYLAEDESFRSSGYIALAALALFAGLVIWLGGRAWKQLRDPSQHPTVQRVYKGPDPVGTAVAAERAAGAPNFTGGNGWVVADPFLIRRTFFSFDMLRLPDLLWAYKKVTQHRVNFIPAGKTYAAQLFCYGGGAEIHGKEDAVESILRFAGERAPWAIFGFSEDLQRLFTKDTNGFCLAVEQRKRDLAGAKPRDAAQAV